MDPEKTVLEVVQEGVQEVMDILQEYNDISMKFMEPMDDDQMNRLIERQGELTEQIEHLGGWEIDTKLERAMDALQCPPSEQKIKELSGGERRRVALCPCTAADGLPATGWIRYPGGWWARPEGVRPALAAAGGTGPRGGAHRRKAL